MKRKTQRTEGSIRLHRTIACFCMALALVAAFAPQAALAAGEPSPWKRLAGNSALSTMKTVVDEGWGTSDRAIVATNKGYWDALSAAGVAGLLKAPVLMTAPDKLSYATRTTLKSHNTKHVVIAGGTAAVSDKVASQIRSMGISVERVKGGNAVGTSRAMYRFGLKHGGWSADAIVATSDGFQDALSAAPYAYANAAPIFLTTLKKKP